MENQEDVFVGCVMGWESESTPKSCEPFSFTPQVVIEFCAGGSPETGVINPTPRMRELAATRFQPIAIVFRDSSNLDDHYLFARNGISDAFHMQLLEDAEAIFAAAASVGADSAHSSCPELERPLQSKSAVQHE
jgi:hypothetical protein